MARSKPKGDPVLKWFGLILMAALAAGCAGGSPATVAVITEPPATASETPFQPSPVPTVAPTPACREGAGTWTEAEYPGVAVRAVIPVWIYLPACHEVSASGYPVAYFLHGKPYTEDQWLALGIQDLVEEGAASAELEPMILVLARQPEPLFSGSDGGPGSYETEFLEGLVPWVDRTYRTDARPEKRAVVGLSRGGVWALELAMTHPDVLGTVVALSPSLAVNYARPPYDPSRLADTAPVLPENILLAAGETDWALTETVALADRLRSRGETPEVVIVPGSHMDPTWKSLLPDVLAFLSRAL